MAGQDLAESALTCEEDVVRILNENFQKQQYYIEVGELLVTVNPWTSLARVEDEIVDITRVYQSKDKHQPLPPHPCCVAEQAVRNASDGVIIPLGESGSGKSSNIQIILQYLALRSQPHEKLLNRNTTVAIIEVLDLFCNAGSLMCDNSTRCLKVYEVFFDANEQNLLGVNVKISILDKLRVISQIKGESNYHIFHRLLNGLNSEQLEEYFLNEEHRYAPSVQREAFCGDGHSLSQSLKCFETLGFHEKEIEDILHLVSAIILLGDVRFGESSKRDVIAFRNGEVLEKAAMLVGVPCSTLAGLIITKSKTLRGNKVNVSSSCSRAMYECDGLAVICYETLVMWIEARINSKCTTHSRLQSDYSLVLLDVFGWENYNICSFQQLCVNSVNEALQSTYNAVVFKLYQTDLQCQDVYLDEPCEKFDQPGAVPLLFKAKGLLDVLHSNTESRGNDQSLLKKLDTSFKNEPRYISNDNQEFSGFLIEHFIGEVSYDVSGFVSQSKNWSSNNILTCLKGSRNKVVSAMAQERINRENSSLEKSTSSNGSSPKKSSVVEKDWLKTNIFKTNSGKDKKKFASIRTSNPAIVTMTLTSVLDRISSSKVYFIRCINSNLRMQPGVFDQERVLRQVQWSNLYGTAKTRLACLKSCCSLPEFISRYRVLFFYLTRAVSPTPELCHSVLSKKFDNSQYRVGRTKVFLSRNLVIQLDEKVEKTILQVTLIQKVFRGFLGRKQYESMIKIKTKYDEQRSFFFSEITGGLSKFHEHLKLQICEDQRRLKENKLKEEQAKSEAKESKHIPRRSKQPVTSPGNQGRRTSYACGEEVITDETSDSLTWCKILCFQRTKQQAMFSVMEPKVFIDGTNHIFTTDRIGFNSFETPSHDKQMKKIKACIGKGVQLYLSNDGSLIAVRLCKNPIFVKGHFCEDKLLETLGELTKNEESKVFNYRSFIEKINYECHPARVARDSEDRCLAMCVVHLCFVKNSDSDDAAPCWTEIVLTQALQFVKDAISHSMQQRRAIQEKYHFQQPPALRMDSKMESTSAKILKLIRPSRYIETVRFKRKAWARKRVVNNPFLFGDSSFSEESDMACSPGSEDGSTMFDDALSPVMGGQGIYENIQGSVKNVEEINQSSPVSKDEELYENMQGEHRWQDLFEASERTPLSGDVSEEDERRQLFDSQRDMSLDEGNFISDTLYENYTMNENLVYVNSLEDNNKQTSSRDSYQIQRHNTTLTSHGTSLVRQEITSVEDREHATTATVEHNTEDLYVNINDGVRQSLLRHDDDHDQEYSASLEQERVMTRKGVYEIIELPRREQSFRNDFNSPQSSTSNTLCHIPCPDYMDSVYVNLFQKDEP